MEIQWFPGHMLKTQRLIQENRDKVDVFIELVDSRAPLATSNPLLSSLIQGKPRVVALNKSDLADPFVLKSWKNFYDAQQDTQAVLLSCKERKNITQLIKTAEDLCKTKKWFSLRKVRAMIVGVPNVGKSTLINTLAGGHKASVAPKPGHTKGLQRINAGTKLDLLDTPGILWHKFENPETGVRLALLGSVKDELVSLSDLVLALGHFLFKAYPKMALEYWGKLEMEGLSEDLWDNQFWLLMELWARKRGMLKKGAEIDWDRVYQAVITEFRNGRIGKISLERP